MVNLLTDSKLGLISPVRRVASDVHNYLSELNATYRDVSMEDRGHRKVINSRGESNIELVTFVRPMSVPEKIKAFNINPENIAITYYFESRGGRLYGAVVPYSQKNLIDISHLENRILDDIPSDQWHYARHEENPDNRRARQLILRRSSSLPYNMSAGNCGPFISRIDRKQDSSLRYSTGFKKGSVVRIVYEESMLGRTMEFAYPGVSSISLQTNFFDVVTLVNREFPKTLISGNIVR